MKSTGAGPGSIHKILSLWTSGDYSLARLPSPLLRCEPELLVKHRKIPAYIQQLWLCLPLLASFASDAFVTLIGQSSKYWSGEYQEVNEINPISNFFLRIHPLLYIAYCIVLLGLINFLIVLLPSKLSKILTMFLFLAYTIGTYTWLRNVFYIDYAVRQTLLIFPAILLAYAFIQAEGLLICHRDE